MKYTFSGVLFTATVAERVFRVEAVVVVMRLPLLMTHYWAVTSGRMACSDLHLMDHC
jgi:hypothetical protein